MHEQNSAHELLTDEQTKQLLARTHAGDAVAREKLVNSNLRLVRSIVGRYSYRQHELEDLYQLGCIGLLKAIDRFDLSHDVKFSTYAVPLILGEVRRYLRDNGPVKVARGLRELAIKARRGQEELRQSLGREATIEELAQSLQVTVEMLVMAETATAHPTSIHEQVYQDDGRPIFVLDQLALDEQPDTGWVDTIALQEVLTDLSPREQQIIKLRYFQNKTQTEIASSLHVSQVQVSRLEKQILGKLRQRLLDS